MEKVPHFIGSWTGNYSFKNSIIQKYHHLKVDIESQINSQYRVNLT